jgi:pyruvate,water dikinase
MFRLFKNPPQVGAKVEKHVIESVSSFGHEESFGDVIYSGSQIKGVGCSAGIVTGTARIIESLDDSATMQRGDILLTHYTDPSWTTLMSLARGIVLVGGGILSHAAVVARELKIPCIVQLKETMSITSGSTITIDGTKGIVKIETLLEN